MKKTKPAPAPDPAALGIVPQTLALVSEIEPNPWNPNKQSDFIYAREKKSITDHGFIDPVTVRQLNGSKRLQIIDGEHRWRAAKDLGMKSIPVINLGEVPDAKAKQLTALLNEIKGHYDPFKMAALIQDVLSTTTRESLEASMPFSTEEIDNFLVLKDFKWEGSEIKSKRGLRDEVGYEHLNFTVTEEQAKIVREAIARIVTALELTGPLKDGRALELIAADSMNTPIESYK